MNYLDVFLALPLLWGIYRGFTKGFIISVATLAALLLGVFAAIHFSDFFGEYINKWFHPEPGHLKVLSFAITFILVVIIVRLIGWGLDKLIKAVALGFVNRILGLVFNFLKWALILSILISIMDSGERTRNLIKPELKTESVLYIPLSKIAPLVFPYLKFNRFMEKHEDTTPETTEKKEV